MKPVAFNSVLPAKVYVLFDGSRKLGEVIAENVHEAFRMGRINWPKANNCSLMPGRTTLMFEE